MNLITRVLAGMIMLCGFAMPLDAVLPLMPANDISHQLASIDVWTPDITVFGKKNEAVNDVLPDYMDDMLAFARKFTGLRYRRGGKTPKGFDCSGFTSYVFKEFGMKLGASSRDQYRQGDGVERHELLPGDLVFFGGRRAGKTVGHVGIVTSVDDAAGTFRFIHSACSSGIVESNSAEPYYSRRYIGARRVSE